MCCCCSAPTKKTTEILKDNLGEGETICDAFKPPMDTPYVVVFKIEGSEAKYAYFEEQLM